MRFFHGIILFIWAQSALAANTNTIAKMLLVSQGILQSAIPGINGACVCRVEETYNPNCRNGLVINTNDHGDDWCWISRYLVRQACDDKELQGECLKADDEIHDWGVGVYSLRDTLIDQIIRRNESVSLMEIAVTKRSVTKALENLRTNLGLHLECSHGLQTQTLVNGTHSHCYSPELLEVCEYAKSKAPKLYNGLVRELKRLADEDPNIISSFVEAFEAGMNASDNTIDINCNVTAHNLFEITSDSTTISSTLVFIPTIAAIIFLSGF